MSSDASIAVALGRRARRVDGGRVSSGASPAAGVGSESGFGPAPEPSWRFGLPLAGRFPGSWSAAGAGCARSRWRRGPPPRWPRAGGVVRGRLRRLHARRPTSASPLGRDLLGASAGGAWAPRRRAGTGLGLVLLELVRPAWGLSLFDLAILRTRVRGSRGGTGASPRRSGDGTCLGRRVSGCGFGPGPPRRSGLLGPSGLAGAPPRRRPLAGSGVAGSSAGSPASALRGADRAGAGGRAGRATTSSPSAPPAALGRGRGGRAVAGHALRDDHARVRPTRRLRARIGLFSHDPFLPFGATRNERREGGADGGMR